MQGKVARVGCAGAGEWLKRPKCVACLTKLAAVHMDAATASRPPDPSPSMHSGGGAVDTPRSGEEELTHGRLHGDQSLSTRPCHIRAGQGPLVQGERAAGRVAGSHPESSITTPGPSGEPWVDTHHTARVRKPGVPPQGALHADHSNAWQDATSNSATTQDLATLGPIIHRWGKGREAGPHQRTALGAVGPRPGKRGVHKKC